MIKSDRQQKKNIKKVKDCIKGSERRKHIKHGRKKNATRSERRQKDLDCKSERQKKNDKLEEEKD